MNPTIHWLGAGLSSTPGIRRLAHSDLELIVWNLDRRQTVDALLAAGVDTDVREIDFSVLRETVSEGDIVVSMLPATMHLQVAKQCLEQRTHFVSSSYVTPSMAELHDKAVEAGLCFVNESGLDPGIDHLFSHLLVDNYVESGPHPDDRLCFRSYCGGFPKTPNEFRYKFSWSPLGTLMALTSPAQRIEDGERRQATRPWEAVHELTLPGHDETFQCYPNRDSLAFLEQYGFDPNWHLEQFVRGTLRLDGWAEAWEEVLAHIGTIDRADAATELEPIAEALGHKYSYLPGEADRVVLSVELEVRRGDETVWLGSHLIDACGNERGQAMARLVSQPVSLAAESVVAGDFEPGVHAATNDPRVIENWLAALKGMGENLVSHRS